MIFGDKRRQGSPSISGTKLDALQFFYKGHYHFLSSLTHQKAPAVAAAVIAAYPSDENEFELWVSRFVFYALLLLAAILAELQSSGGYDKHPKLIELWTYLNEMNADSKELWCIRYKSLVADDI